MNKPEKKKQQEQIIKSLTIGRYTFLRYFTTIIFFMCLYWFLSSLLAGWSIDIFVPMIIGISQILVNLEIYRAIQFRNDGKLIKSFYILLVNIIILLISLVLSVKDYKLIFPYITSRKFALTFLIVVIVLVVLCFYRVSNIKNMTDRTYQKIKKINNN